MNELIWDQEASAALAKVPALVRPLARRKIEEAAKAQGEGRVSLALVSQAQERFQALLGGRSPGELAGLLPQANRPGASLVVLEACRGLVGGCPNALMDLEPWRQALEEWLKASQVSERLRARLGGDGQVLFHHKLRLALCACPNGCARPQIADLALVAQAQPVFELADCTACGACARACPDQALSLEGQGPLWEPRACLGCRACQEACPQGCVSLGEPRARLFLGGKLGRHPHLAQEVGQAQEPAQAVAKFARAVDDYLQQAEKGERFAAWWQRARAGRERA